MKFTVMAQGQPIGTLSITEEVYLCDAELLSVLADADYIDRSEILEVFERVDPEDHIEKVDLIDPETNFCRVSLVLIQ